MNGVPRIPGDGSAAREVNPESVRWERLFGCGAGDVTVTGTPLRTVRVHAHLQREGVWPAASKQKLAFFRAHTAENGAGS